MTHQDRQREEELRHAHLLASHLNRTKGTDYVASNKGVVEPADVHLESPTTHPTIKVQVVTAPTDHEHREDNDAVRKTRDAIAAFLEDENCPTVRVALHPQPFLLQRGIPRGLITRLGSFLLKQVRDMGAEDLVSIDGTQLFLDHQEQEIARFVSTISLFTTQTIRKGIKVDITDSAYLHDSAISLENAMKKKVGKYGDSSLDHWLLINGHWTVTDAQVEAARTSALLECLDFAEVWITGSFCKTARLK